MSNSSIFFLSLFLSPSMLCVGKGCVKAIKYMGRKCMILLSGKLSYPSLLIDWGFLSAFCLTGWLFLFFLRWYHTVGPGSAISSVYAACWACWGQRGWLLSWNTLQKWAMDINSSVYGWSKNIFFFYNHLVRFICLCLIQFYIELDVFNNFMNLSMGFSLNYENLQMFF